MLKKTQKSQNLVSTKKPSVECSICKSCSPGKAFYICESGHVLCENCRQPNESEKRKDSGDCVPGKNRSKHSKKQENMHTKSSCFLTKDLASGDHDKRDKTHTKETKSKSECRINFCKDHVDTKNTLENNTAPKEKLETIIEYRNSNYKDDRSSTSSLDSSSSKHNLELVKELPKLPDHYVCPRWYNFYILEFTGPVQCPVEACNKMIALDSVMLHFYFDHSKVPRMTLCKKEARRIYVKSSSLCSEAQCLCIFSLQEHTDAKEVQSSDCKSILLMGAKIQMEKLKLRDEKSSTMPISVRDITTQTELQRSDTAKKSIIHNNTNCIKKCEPYRKIAQTEFDNNEILLLWLCKQDDSTDSYSISVLSRDKKRGFSYIGEAIHIRNEQSPADMFQKADCLMVPGAALNRLLDEKNHICVVVNILG
ncbi:hypothetical protein NE865_02806 [Phthorimaea operculella]|nr:hypothetical protein NE865_02806 [Phthorimaea operculella]